MESTATAATGQPAFDARAAGMQCARNVAMAVAVCAAGVAAFGWIASNWSWLWPTTLQVLSLGGHFWGAVAMMALAWMPCAWSICVAFKVPDPLKVDESEKEHVEKAFSAAMLRAGLISLATLPVIIALAVALESTFDTFGDLNAYAKIAAALCYLSATAPFLAVCLAAISFIDFE